MTRQNQQNDMCAQRRLRSAWASIKSDQSLRCPHEEALGPWPPIERTAKTLISLGGCPGWSVFAGRTVILLVLSCRGSYILSSWLIQSISSLQKHFANAEKRNSQSEKSGKKKPSNHIKDLKKVQSSIKLFFFQFSEFIFSDINDSVSY